MRSYHGGDRVNPGMYWSRISGTFFTAPDQGALLPGEVTERYVQLPAPVGVAIGSLLGVGYVLFFPLVGIVGLPVFLGCRLLRRSPKGIAEPGVLLGPQPHRQAGARDLQSVPRTTGGARRESEDELNGPPRG